MGQLERYGIYVLVVVLFLILGVAIWGGEPGQDGTTPLLDQRDQQREHRIDPVGDEELAIYNDRGELSEFEDVDGDIDDGRIDGGSGAGPDGRNETIDRETIDRETVEDGAGDRGDSRRDVEDRGAERQQPRVDDAAPARERRYTLKPGEALSQVARKFYGKATEWKRIAAANGIDDPRRVRHGTELVIPPFESTPRPAVNSGGGGTASNASGERVHVVVRGDSPARISKRYFNGSERMAKAIMDLNGITDPLSLQVGAKLRIPVDTE